MTGEAFYESEQYKELLDLTSELSRWYAVGKVTWYVVYVYDIDDPEMNLFDIWRDEIVMLDESHTIPPKAMKAVREIQEKLKETVKFMEGE